ncbi:class I lanthipeptide [uncultured Kordia sp.]|uniref:class I lanthipeptide n=1 Tax=uncultured Kordia sp. TaxID=507699 RepID=UPI002607C4DE|nr:class I lanthipeptide [uncultured Kordia sp.]
MKKRNLKNGLTLKKRTISSLSDKAAKGGTGTTLFTTIFADLCYGVQTSNFLKCAAQCPPTDTNP